MNKVSVETNPANKESAVKRFVMWFFIDTNKKIVGWRYELSAIGSVAFIPAAILIVAAWKVLTGCLRVVLTLIILPFFWFAIASQKNPATKYREAMRTIWLELPEVLD